MGLRWKGENIKRRMQAASIIGINGTMAQAVGYAKGNHPWENRTTTLEKGTRMVQSAAMRGAKVSGLWGVANVLYAKYLEGNKKWRWLAPTARVIYPRLAANIKAAYSRG